MTKTLILGGGFGGVSAAVELARVFGPGHVTLIERKADFMMGLRKLWAMVGIGSLAEGRRPLAALSKKGVRVEAAEIDAIDTKARKVATGAGEFEYDYLIVALGIEPRPDLVPGFSREAVYDLYDVRENDRLAARIAELRSGRVVVGIGGMPYKCPPAPYEATLLLEEHFRRRGVRDAIELSVFTPQPTSLPVAGKAASALVEQRLGERKVAFLPSKKLTRLEGSRAVFEEGALDADVMLLVPAHRPPRVVKASGLTGGGEWVKVDPATLRTSDERVWAVGDLTDIPMANGNPMPKAGVFAEAQGKVAAAWIAHLAAGGPVPEPFDGRGYCFMEVGGGQAAKVRGEFLATPAPKVEMAPPSAETFEEKKTFERSRLEAWFGA